MKNFIKRLSDGGLAEDIHAFMELALDENVNKEDMVNKQEFIKKACTIYRKHLTEFNPMLKEFTTALDEAVSIFKKQLDE